MSSTVEPARNRRHAEEFRGVSGRSAASVRPPARWRAPSGRAGAAFGRGLRGFSLQSIDRSLRYRPGMTSGHPDQTDERDLAGGRSRQGRFASQAMRQAAPLTRLSRHTSGISWRYDEAPVADRRFRGFSTHHGPCAALRLRRSSRCRAALKSPRTGLTDRRQMTTIVRRERADLLEACAGKADDQ